SAQRATAYVRKPWLVCQCWFSLHLSALRTQRIFFNPFRVRESIFHFGLYSMSGGCSMTKLTESLALELIGLPIKERAALAKKLLESLDAERDPEVEELWAAEVNRRIE